MTGDAENRAETGVNESGNHRSAKRLPAVPRVGRLDTAPRRFREMQRVYRLARQGVIEVADMAKFIYALRGMDEHCLEQLLEARLADLEARAEQAGLVVQRKPNGRPLRLVGHG